MQSVKECLMKSLEMKSYIDIISSEKPLNRKCSWNSIFSLLCSQKNGSRFKHDSCFTKILHQIVNQWELNIFQRNIPTFVHQQRPIIFIGDLQRYHDFTKQYAQVKMVCKKMNEWRLHGTEWCDDHHTRHPSNGS